MSQDDDNWTFYDWFILFFLALMIVGLLSALYGPPAPVEPGFLER